MKIDLDKLEIRTGIAAKATIENGTLAPEDLQTIWGNVTDFDPEQNKEIEVASLDGFVTLPGRYSYFRLDAESGDLGHVGAAIEAMNKEHEVFGGIYIIDKVRVLPKYRGNDLGLLMAKAFIDAHCQDEFNYVVLQPHPVSAECLPEKERKAAAKKLQTYWGRLGFKRIKGTDVYALHTGYLTEIRKRPVSGFFNPDPASL